jgi:hypothetical protein
MSNRFAESTAAIFAVLLRPTSSILFARTSFEVHGQVFLHILA